MVRMIFGMKGSKDLVREQKLEVWNEVMNVDFDRIKKEFGLLWVRRTKGKKRNRGMRHMQMYRKCIILCGRMACG